MPNADVPATSLAQINREQAQLMARGAARVAAAFGTILGNLKRDTARCATVGGAIALVQTQMRSARRTTSDGLTQWISTLIAQGLVVGRYHALLEAIPETHRFAEGVPGVPSTWTDEQLVQRAMDFLMGKDMLTPEDFAAITDSAKYSAFTIAGATRERMLAIARDELVDALEAGDTPQEAADRMNARLVGAGYDPLRPSHALLVAEQNFSQAYGAASWQALHDPRIAGLIPFFRYYETTLVEHLGTPRPEHVRYHNKFFRRDNPIWNLIWPPNGFRCRCKVIGVNVQTVRTYGITQDRVPMSGGKPVQPDPGFRSNPRAYLKRQAAAA